jgi:serine phosphatase RsbU (regulator of sigma subunit)
VTERVPENTIGSTLRPIDWSRFDGVDIYAGHHSECRGGDFFDALMVGDRVLFLVTDIAGPRTAALSVALAVQSVFRRKAEELFRASEAGGHEANESEAVAGLAHAVNLSLIEAVGGVHFAPTFLGCFQRTHGILTYCNAGNLLALASGDSDVRVLQSGGMPLGLFSHVTFEAMFLALQQGESMLLVTKGVAELGAERLSRLLKGPTPKSASALCDDVLREAYDSGGASLPRLLGFLHGGGRDDLTALALVRRS